ncbi:hypothetical protein GPECTOR_46g268 [Gonium pectorale]|uniref:Uncharacterized protein n=1 Tax=Gonium pectorale TaxID=33097 RepID=A0A150G8L6_GONPE|nr:hypothetical protein GPECTOR_46g268 [Gonium pectorale]|eukprot:KXZ46199.1 hypothetical protein GPECTOR_46g268 [Gonium pectorale]
MDALTKAGVELKGKRAKTFTLFKNDKQRPRLPRWEGVQFTYVDDRGERVTYQEGYEKKFPGVMAAMSG